MKILVGLGTCGIAAGAEETFRALEEKLPSVNGAVRLEKTGCIGMCYREPLVEIRDAAGARFQYGNLTKDKIDRLLEEHVGKGNAIEDWLVWTSGGAGSEAGYLNRQNRIVLRNCGNLNPEEIEDYVEVGGYKALEGVLTRGDPDALINQIIESGLRGRGGAGFLTGMKWRLTRLAAGGQKYIICNADEGDPGAFMDRSVLEGDPHSVLEGMAIAGYAIGATDGYIYVRAEYPKAIERLNIAIGQAKARGFLGDDILGTPFRFHVKLKEGAGAFVCGEETALICSIEGKRGMPRVRPPFPATKGLWDCPTSINNVETFANVPWIVTKGPAAFNTLGTKNSKGTKVFAMAGKVKRGGLVEVPMGISIAEIVHGICGGIQGDKKFKAVQMGGPSGGCIPAELQDTLIDYESINKTGAIMGSGGLVVMDETTCMVDIARFFLDFTQRESCGKCTFCRVGHEEDARDPDPDHGREGQGRRHRAARTARLPREEQLSLRAGTVGPQPGSDDAQVLPIRIRGAHQQQEVPRAQLHGAPDLHDYRGVQRMHGVRPRLPLQGDHGREEADARDRSLEMHPVRRVLQDLPLPRDHAAVNASGE